MRAIEPDHLASPPAPAFRAGAYAFVGPTTGTDAYGQLIDAADGGYTQALAAFRRIERGLADVGLGLADVVQTRMYSSPGGREAVAARGVVMSEAGVRPSALGFRLRTLEQAPADVEVGVVAVAREGAAASRRHTEDASAFGQRGAYASAVRVGDHVLISGTVAADVAGAMQAGDAAGQARALVDRFARELDRLGASLADIVLTRIYLHDLRDLDVVAAVHAERLGDVRPVTSVTEAFRFGGDDCFVKFEAEAIVGGAERWEPDAGHWPQTGCAGMVAAGGQILIGGRTAAGAGDAAAQCEAILTRIESDLQRTGSSLADVVQLHAQVTGPQDAERVRSIVDARVPGPVAAAVLIVRDIGRAGARVQVDARALRGRA